MISLSIVLMVILFNRRLPVVMARTMWAPGILWGCGIKIEISKSVKIDPKIPHVFISNHLSYLDIPVLFKIIPSNLYFVAKEEIRKLPFIGQYMMATGMIFVNREDRHKAIISLKKAAMLVNKGKSVLMFPEGTRSRDGKLRSFKKGPFHLAQDANVGMVPVAITGTDQVLDLKTKRITPGRVDVGIGSPIYPSEFSDIGALMDRCREEIISLKGEPVKA